MAQGRPGNEAIYRLPGRLIYMPVADQVQGTRGTCPPFLTSSNKTRGGTTSACQRKRFRHTFLRSKFGMCVLKTCG